VLGGGDQHYLVTPVRPLQTAAHQARGLA
jgi:hypothetical protein